LQWRPILAETRPAGPRDAAGGPFRHAAQAWV